MWTIWNGEPMKREEIRELEQIAEAFAPSVEQIADGLYDHPEIKYEEFFAYKTYTDYLKRQGMTVTEHAADIATAFVASYKQGEKGPCIALLAEYDALPNLGHGCGHNLLGAASLLAFETTVRYMKEKNIPGEIRLYGCPAEEGGAGKSRMVKAGVFAGVREALTWHPADYNAITSGSSLANCQILFTFHGKSAHAAIAPHLGRSALDACELMNVGANYLREHVLQDTRIHYAYQDAGGKSPNTVPEEASILYQIRAPKSSYVDEVSSRIVNIAKGAALMTETTVEYREVSRVEELRPCHRLEKLLYENMCQATPISYTEEERLQAAEIAKQNPYNTLEDLLVKCDRYPDGGAMKAMLTAHMQDVIYDFVLPYMPDDAPHYYSTDVGDVSGICDTAQFAGCTWAANTMEHTKAVVAQGKSSIAHKGLRFAAGVLAATAVDCLRRTE